ncbi:hypothetical protein ACFOD4_08615 [Pseudoroseomonas globiformis]|uniref:Uncharacterized protein n=1 Tax=Teichococcus globiformis TaxID=2307229 RepID=A0ABV7G106_9PROT
MRTLTQFLFIAAGTGTPGAVGLLVRHGAEPAPTWAVELLGAVTVSELAAKLVIWPAALAILVLSFALSGIVLAQMLRTRPRGGRTSHPEE